MGSYCKFDNECWLVFRLLAWPTQHNVEVGTVAHKTNTEIIVAASDGFVSLQYFERAAWLKDVINAAT